jgi:hypothetical protein
MLRQPKQSDNHTAAPVDQVKLTTERVKSIGRDAGVEMVDDYFETTQIVTSSIEAMVADITGGDPAEMSDFELNTYVIEYLNGVQSGVDSAIKSLQDKFNTPRRKRTTRR